MSIVRFTKFEKKFCVINAVDATLLAFNPVRGGEIFAPLDFILDNYLIDIMLYDTLDEAQNKANEYIAAIVAPYNH